MLANVIYILPILRSIQHKRQNIERKKKGIELQVSVKRKWIVI